MKRRDIELKRYEARVVNGIVKHFAIAKDDKEYPMPDAFKEMYTDDYLQIRETSSEMPEVFNLPEGETFYIPIRTAPLTTESKKVKS